MPSEVESVRTDANPVHGMEEEMKIEFFYPMQKIPTVTAQEKGVNFKTKDPKKRFYKKPEIQKVENLYKAMLLPNRPQQPMRGAIALKVSFRFPLAKGHHEGDFKTTKPDTENMLKLLKDCMTSVGYWKDDSQVAYEVVKKTYSKDSGIYVYAETIDQV